MPAQTNLRGTTTPAAQPKPTPNKRSQWQPPVVGRLGTAWTNEANFEDPIGILAAHNACRTAVRCDTAGQKVLKTKRRGGSGGVAAPGPVTRSVAADPPSGAGLRRFMGGTISDRPSADEAGS